jgi:NAD(P)-dependent dehydrogenase (short-subunit alcohol dehydrogenase family)
VHQIRRQRLGGVIVYIASKNGVFVGPSRVACGSIKAAQAHQARLLAAEVGGDFGKTTGAIIPVDGGIPVAFPR